MPHRLAFVIAFVIGAVFVADFTYFHWNLHVFLMQKLHNLVLWLAFWR